jgi:hypothetical protein
MYSRYCFSGSKQESRRRTSVILTQCSFDGTRCVLEYIHAGISSCLIPQPDRKIGGNAALVLGWCLKSRQESRTPIVVHGILFKSTAPAAYIIDLWLALNISAKLRERGSLRVLSQNQSCVPKQETVQLDISWFAQSSQEGSVASETHISIMFHFFRIPCHQRWCLSLVQIWTRNEAKHLALLPPFHWLPSSGGGERTPVVD